MRSRTLKACMILLLAVGLAGAIRAAADEPPPARKAAPPRSQRPSPWGDERGPFTYAGRVVGPDGKPVAGAKLYLLYQTPKELPVPARATSDAEGRYQFTVPLAEFDRSYSRAPWRAVYVVAVAPGFGLGMGGMSPPRVESRPRLEKEDAPLTGRVLDLQGKPVAGVGVRVHGLYAPWVERGGAGKEDLVKYVIARNDGNGRPPARGPRFLTIAGDWLGRDLGTLFPPVKTGADGRFTIKGVGNDRVAELRVEGPAVATQKVFAMTWAGKTVRAEGPRFVSRPADVLTVYGNGFDHIAAPSQPVVGVVRDKDTGKPVPGAVVTNSRLAGFPTGGAALRAVADKEGRYRLLGLPKGKNLVLRAGPPDDEPYLTSEEPVPDAPGLAPVTVDFRLKRGVWLAGRVLDKATREPARARIEYAVFEDNPHRDELRRAGRPSTLENRADDGTFRLVAVPGRGLLAAQALPDFRSGRVQRYSEGVGADRIKGLSPNGYFLTYPRLLVSRHYNTFVEVSPAADAKQVTCDILLDPGRELTVTVLGPDGKPLTGVRARGLESLIVPRNVRSAEFVVSGVGPGQPRLLQFDHPEKNLAGSLVVKGDEKGPLTVKLTAAGVLTGRLVTPDGEPVAEGEIVALGGGPDVPVNRERPDRGSLPERVRPDKDGKFRITGLAPGLKYRFLLVRRRYGHRFGGGAADDLTFKPGETKDLGDVVIKFNE